VMSGERLVRIDRHLSEYLLFQTLWALFKSRFTGYSWDEIGGFQTAAILAAWQYLPPGVLRPERNKRQHVSHLLSRNEVDRDYTYNRRLFVRVAHGWYQFNPALSVRRRNASGEAWLPICDALNVRFVAECADPQHWAHIDTLLGLAGQLPMVTPIGGERIARQLAAEHKQREAVRREMEALRRQVEDTEHVPVAARAPHWGTKEARCLEVERIRREIAENTAKRARDGEPIE